MRVLTKAVLGGAALAVAVGVTGGGTALMARHSTGRLQQFQRRDATLQRLVSEMQQDFYNYDDQNNMYVLVAATAPGAEDLWKTTYDQARQAAAELQQHIDGARRLTSDRAMVSLLDRVQRDKTAYDRYFANGYRYVLAGQVTRAGHEETVANLQPSNDIMPALGALQSRADRQAASSLRQVTSAQRLVEVAAGAAVGVVSLFVLLLLVGFVRAVLRPIGRLGARLHEIGAGEADLTVRIGGHRDDEFGELAAGFDRFLDGLQTLIGQVAGSARTLTRSAEELSAMSDTLTSGASRTAELATSAAGSAREVQEGVEVVTEGSRQMTASIAEIAANAGRAAQTADESQRIAAGASDQIAALGEAGEQITGVVGLITSIAEQTNLLALNATIEAARAGEAGAGFAVVANEVKDLAQETSRATDDITRRIAGLQDSSREATEAIEQIERVIGELHGYATSIAAAVEQQSAATGEINRAIGEATVSSGSVTRSVTSVAESAGETSSSAEVSHRAAAELVSVAEQLGAAVSRFRYA